MIPEIKILDESGAELQPLGWGGPTGRRGDYVDWRRGYEPTRQRRFAVKITGYHLQDYVETRFEPGAYHDSGGLRVFVDSVVAEDQRSQVVISYEDDLGERELSNYHVYLGLGSRRTQVSARGSVTVDAEKKEITLTWPHKLGPNKEELIRTWPYEVRSEAYYLELVVTRLEEVSEEIKVIVPEKPQ